MTFACVIGTLGADVIVSGAAAPGAYGWGNNQTGEVADGTTTTRKLPVPSVGLGDALSMSVGEVHGLAALRDGSVVAWGHNKSGQLGNGSTTDSLTPVGVRGLGTAKAIAAGDSFSLAVLGNGQVLAWGKNRSGELGDGKAPTAKALPVGVVGLGAGSGVIALAGGHSHALALKADGTVLAWGNNQSGQLGDGSAPTDHDKPVQVAGLGAGSGVVQIAAGGSGSFALKSNGVVLAWGNNQTGALGDGSTPTDHHTPVQVAGLGPGSGVVKVVAGFSSAYALKRDGTVVAWGNNQKGETGSGDAPNDHPTPTTVRGLGGIVDIAAGWEHGLALAGNGTVFAWGDNRLGQLGDGTTTVRPVPVTVAGFGAGSNALAVFAGGFHSHVLVGFPKTPTTGTPGTGGGNTGGGPTVAPPPGTPGSTGPNGGGGGPGSARGTGRRTSISRSSVATPIVQTPRTTG